MSKKYVVKKKKISLVVVLGMLCVIIGLLKIIYINNYSENNVIEFDMASVMLDSEYGKY